MNLGIDYLHGLKRIQYAHMFSRSTGMILPITQYNSEDSLRSVLASDKENNEAVQTEALTAGIGVRQLIGARGFTGLYMDLLLETGSMTQKLDGFDDRKVDVTRAAAAFGLQVFYGSGAFWGVRAEVDQLKKALDLSFMEPSSKNLLFLEIGYGW